MSSDKMKLALEIIGSSAGAQAALRQTQSSVRAFANNARQEFKSIQGFMGSTMGKLAGIGAGFGAYQLIKGSAMLDKSLTRIGQMAGVGKEQIQQLRDELFTMSERTGKPIEFLSEGFEKLIASGGGFNQAKGMIGAINDATAVTSANAETLALAMTTAAEIFPDLDLSKVEESVLLLDKMAVGADLGSAELENLGAMFSKVAPRANDVGMSLDQTIAFLELLSKVEKSPEVLGTMADATLRIFNNTALINRLERKGISFFNPDKSRRSVFEVFKDLRSQYKKIDSERGQQNFMSMMFQGVDERSMRGLRSLLGTDLLDSADGFVERIENAGGKIKKDLPDSIDNAHDQVARLNAALRKAGEGFAKPINDAIKETFKFLKDKRGMSGGEIAGVGARAMLAAYIGSRFIKGAVGRVLQTGTGAVGGIAAGKALEVATGVTPVFVTNWPAGGVGAGSGIPGIAGGVGVPDGKSSTALGLLKKAGLVTGVGLVTYDIVSTILKLTGGTAALEELGAKIHQAQSTKDNLPPVNIEITIDKEGRPIIKSNVRADASSVKVKNRGSLFSPDVTPNSLFIGSN